MNEIQLLVNFRYPRIIFNVELRFMLKCLKIPFKSIKKIVERFSLLAFYFVKHLYLNFFLLSEEKISL